MSLKCRLNTSIMAHDIVMDIVAFNGMYDSMTLKFSNEILHLLWVKIKITKYISHIKHEKKALNC